MVRPVSFQLFSNASSRTEDSDLTNTLTFSMKDDFCMLQTSIGIVDGLFKSFSPPEK